MQDPQCLTYLSSTGELDTQLFQSSFDCIKIVDLDGRLLELNPGGVIALELDDITALNGHAWADLWPEQSRAVVHAAIAAAAAGQRTQFTAFCPTAKGAPRWWEVAVSSIRGADGQVQRIMAVSRDVTEVALAREALREADRRKDEFLLILAHELRNPLSTVSMAASMLSSQPLTAERVVQIGTLVGRQVGHMSRLVEDLIDMSRVTRGLVSLTLQPIDMRDVAAQAAEQLQSALQAKQQTLSMPIADGALMVQGDRMRLVQVFANILGNAIRYTPAGGRIDLALVRAEAVVLVAITDNGIGIAADKMASLFEQYTQLDMTTERSSSGLGLGLALVRKLVELHHGSVTVHSDGAGLGSTFTVAIPTAPV